MGRIVSKSCWDWCFPAAAAAKSLQSCLSSPPGSPVPGILQARTLEWVAISFSNAWKWKVNVKSFSRVWPFATPREAYSSVYWILQARLLEWLVIPFSKGSSDTGIKPKSLALQPDSLLSEPLGKSQRSLSLLEIVLFTNFFLPWDLVW